jgi:hypothetical protein
MMKKIKKKSNSLFWLKHVLLALTVIAIAVAVITTQQSNQSAVLPEGSPSKKNISSNMSLFYSQYRLSSRNPLDEGLGDFVKKVKTSDTPLSERLRKMESLQNPMPQKWVGEHKHRIFEAGGTLRSGITNYAQSEGMQVIWELDQDFIVKYPFQLDDSLLGSLKRIGKAIDANFDGEVKAYMCPRQRSLVITSQSSKYLEEQCAEALR